MVWREIERWRVGSRGRRHEKGGVKRGGEGGRGYREAGREEEVDGGEELDCVGRRD